MEYETDRQLYIPGMEDIEKDFNKTRNKKSLLDKIITYGSIGFFCFSVSVVLGGASFLYYLKKTDARGAVEAIKVFSLERICKDIEDYAWEKAWGIYDSDKEKDLDKDYTDKNK